MKKFFKKNWIKVLLLVLFLAGFYLRINGLWLNYSFWTDEASTARFARGILETGIPQISHTKYKENSYFITHYLTALSFLIFGINEFSARLPEIVFGSVLILVTYFFGKKFFNHPLIGLGAAGFITFSYIQIAWSRQARGYVILEVFYLLSLLNFYLFLEEKKKINFFLFILFSLLSFWTHTLGLIILPFVFLYLLYEKNTLKFFWKNKLIIGFFLLFLILAVFITNFIPSILVVLKDKILNFKPSGIFVSYYHSLFWRQYPLFTFLTILGLIILWINKRKEKVVFLFLFLTTYLFCISFLVGVPFEKYALPLFPIIFSVSSFTLWEISKMIMGKEKEKVLIFLFLVLFIVGNGNKFSWKPRSFYTLNFDMREIPEIDYKGIYEFIKEKSGNKIEEIALVDISHDIPAWYLGEGKNIFIPRKNISKDKKINENSGGIFIHDLEEFKDVVNQYPKGFVVLVEHNFRFYPDGMVEYVRKNLNLEKKNEIAWFSFDWNKWPVEVYSWGFK